MNRLLLLLLVIGVFFTNAAFAQARCTISPVIVEGDWGRAAFDVRLARDDQERVQGLMFVKNMPRREGMLFLYPNPQPVTFWMKNTLIPLDMLFFDELGTLTHIHENAQPEDLSQIPGGNDVLGVLEINGGLVSAFGINAGSKILHPYFDDAALWPCEVK